MHHHYKRLSKLTGVLKCGKGEVVFWRTYRDMAVDMGEFMDRHLSCNQHMPTLLHDVHLGGSSGILQQQPRQLPTLTSLWAHMAATSWGCTPTTSVQGLHFESPITSLCEPRACLGWEEKGKSSAWTLYTHVGRRVPVPKPTTMSQHDSRGGSFVSSGLHAVLPPLCGGKPRWCRTLPKLVASYPRNDSSDSNTSYGSWSSGHTLRWASRMSTMLVYNWCSVNSWH